MSDRKPRVFEIRPSSVHQHAEPKTIRPSARELWPTVRGRLLRSRPLLEVKQHRHMKDATGKPESIEVLGTPTFRNVIENGEWK